MTVGSGMRPWRRALAAAAVVATVLAGVSTFAQQYFREGTIPPRYAPAEMPDARFIFCRLAYRQVRRESSGIGWQTDYPYAEINLMTRLSELTRTQVSRDEHQDPNYFVVRPNDPALFNCPFVMASDAGTLGFTVDEAARLREYLLKGGFLWVDDFWGSAAWDHWLSQIMKVLPDHHVEDIPVDDPMLRTQYEIKEIPQITNIQFWRGVGGGTTSERGEDSDVVHFRAIRDDHGRVMVLMSHNTDVADSWEREGEDPAFFYQFSPKGYALGVDVLLHVLTH